LLINLSSWFLQLNIERVKKKEPLPETCSGESFRNYLKHNKFWKELVQKDDYVPYSLRHAYAVCAHSQYNINSQVLAPAMGHEVKTHEGSYSRWFGDDFFDDIFEKATQS